MAASCKSNEISNKQSLSIKNLLSSTKISDQEKIILLSYFINFELGKDKELIAPEYTTPEISERTGLSILKIQRTIVPLTASGYLVKRLNHYESGYRKHNTYHVGTKFYKLLGV